MGISLGDDASYDTALPCLASQGMIDNGMSQLTDNPEAPEADVAIACLLVSTAGQR